MKTNRILFLAILFFLVTSLNSIAQTSNLSKDELRLLKVTLETALVTGKNLPDYPNLPNKNEIYLLDKMVAMDDVSKPPVYLSQKQIPEFKGVKIRLVSEAVFKDTARQEDLLVIQLGQLNLPAEKEQPAITYIMAKWALGQESQKKGFTYKQAFGNAMGFKRSKRGWEFLKTFYTFNSENH